MNQPAIIHLIGTLAFAMAIAVLCLAAGPLNSLLGEEE